MSKQKESTMKNADMPINAVTDETGMPFNSLPTESSTIGLTKREHFAAMAMQGLLSSGYNLRALKEDVIEKSIEHADELLKELGK